MIITLTGELRVSDRCRSPLFLKTDPCSTTRRFLLALSIVVHLVLNLLLNGTNPGTNLSQIVGPLIFIIHPK